MRFFLFAQFQRSRTDFCTRFIHSLAWRPHFVSHTKHVYTRRRVRLFNEIIFQYVCNRCERTFIANRCKCRGPMFVSVVLLLFKALSIPEITSNINNNSNTGATFPAVYVRNAVLMGLLFLKLECVGMIPHRVCLSLCILFETVSEQHKKRCFWPFDLFGFQGQINTNLS